MNSERVLSQLLAGGAASGFAGGLAGGLASGLLTSKAGRKMGKKALKVGGIAAVGGLAYAAWNRYRANTTGASPAQAAMPGAEMAAGVHHSAGATALALESPAPAVQATPLERFVPPPHSGAQAEALGLTLLRAMIAAAQADGRLDFKERHAITAHVAQLDLPDQEKEELLHWLERPIGMEELAAAATSEEIAAEIYAASLMAIDVDTPVERAYLQMLAARLGLPAALVESLHQELGLEPAAATPLQRVPA